MSILNVSKSDSNQSRLILEQTERNVNDYINRVKKSEWAYHFNRIFISPGHSFNVKYIIKFLSSKLAQPKQTSSRTRVSSSSSDNRRPTTPRQKRPKAASSRSPTKSNAVTKVSKVDDLIGNEHEYDICDILDKLNDKEWFRLLNIEAGKRMETLIHQYHAFKRTLDNISLEKLEKLHNNVQTEVPYIIYTETAEDYSINTKSENGYFLKPVNSYDVLGTLKTCGVVVIDVSRDVTALSKGRETFRSFKRELVNDMDEAHAFNGKRLIVVISTVMTWTGVSKGHVMYERNVDSRTPSPQCVDHYEFELEVLAVNKTKGLKEIVTTIVVWTGITYGFEQDLFKFAFDSACKNGYDDVFPIPKSRNYVPVIHVENLARLVHQIISENHKLKDHCVFAVETPTYTLKQIITAIGKTYDVNNPMYVSLDVFLNKHKLQGAHRQMISMDVIVNPAINRLWPDFEWYDGKPSIVHKMKSVTGSYETDSNVKNIMKILVLGPPASGKTELARKLAQRYGSMYLEPDEIVKNHIDEILKEITALRTKHPQVYMNDDLSDDVEDQTEQTKADALSVEKMNELDNHLKQLYTSIDANDGTLGDVHLIPLLKAKMSASSRRGYVLDGYPNTANQATSVFSDADARRIDVDRLPDLTVCLTVRETPSRRRTDANVDDVLTNASEAAGETRTVFFSDDNAASSLDLKTDGASATTTPLSTKSAIPDIGTKKRGRPAWDAHKHDGLLKMLNRYYVPMMSVTDGGRADDGPPDATLERRANAVDEETRLRRGGNALDNRCATSGSGSRLSPPDGRTGVDQTRSTVDGSSAERAAANGPRRLCEKMTLLDELEKISDFEHVDRLLTDEYLMRHVTPTLTKLLARVARVRPKNAIEFLAHAAVGQNAEGSPECPGRSENGARIRGLLERAVRVFGADDQTLTGFLAEHSAVRDDEQ